MNFTDPGPRGHHLDSPRLGSLEGRGRAKNSPSLQHLLRSFISLFVAGTRYELHGSRPHYPSRTAYFSLIVLFIFFFFCYPREMLLRIPAGGAAGYVGLALFNGPYPLKPSGVSGAGVTGGGSGSRDAAHLSDPPSAAGRV